MSEFSGATGLMSQAGLDAVKETLGIDACSLWALITVESRGYGFLPSRRPKILFERRWFSKFTHGRYDAAHPDISSPQERGYLQGEAEYDRLHKAMALDRDAALRSASWGLGQIMGFNAGASGYASVDAMIAAFCDSEDAQLQGLGYFVGHKPTLRDSMRSKDWKTFAYHYNGPNYASNEYDSRLAYNFQKYSTQGVPDIDVRAAQVRLAGLEHAPGTVDGVWGPHTAAAMNRFQRAHGLPVTAHIDARTQDALRAAAGF